MNNNNDFTKIALSIIGIILLLVINSEARYWIKRTLRFFFYENLVVSVLRNKFLQIVLPGFSGAYFLCLDVWGDKWKILSDYSEQHQIAFSILVTFSLVILVIRGIADYVEGRGQANHTALMERLMLLASRAVKMKLERFKEEAAHIAPGAQAFERITQPKHQINLLLSEIVDFLHSKFSIKENDLCITIMHFNRNTRKWEFKYETNKEWKHTKPEVLLKKESTAKECLDTGEPVFHADKARAAKKKKYFLSERDKRHGNSVGSVFCYPAFTKTFNGEDRYLISIVTYGKMLCDPLDSEQAAAIRLIFTDICRRIDLELTLESIKVVQQLKLVNVGDAA